MINIGIFNVILFGIFFLFLRKTQRNNQGLKFISLEYLLSAISGVFFIHYGEREYTNLSYYGSIAFFICFFISTLPLYKTEIKHNNKIIINEKFVDTICIICFWGSILPVISSLIELKSLFTGDISSFMKETHDARFYDTDTNNTNLLNILTNISIKTIYYIKAFLPLLVIYLYNKYEKLNKYIWGIFLTQISLIIVSLLGASRFLLVDFTLTYIFTYVLMYHKLKECTKIFFKKLFAIGGCFVFISLMIITIGRAIAMGYVDITSILAWISLYTGEGMLNFNEFTIHDEVRFGMEGVFPTLLNAKDYHQFIQYNSDEYTKEWAWILGHEANTFKSVYGDFVSSFGLYNTILILLTVSIILVFFSQKLIRSFTGIAFLITIYKYIYFGFIYFPYAGISGNNYLYQALLSIIIFGIFEKYGKTTTI